MTRTTTAPKPVTVRAHVGIVFPTPGAMAFSTEQQAFGMVTLRSSVAELVSPHRTTERAMVNAMAEAARQSRRRGVCLVVLYDFECDGTLMSSTSPRVVATFAAGERVGQYRDELDHHLVNCYRRGEF